MGSATEVKLFGRWSYEDVNVSDMSLVDYIATTKIAHTYLPHTQDRYQKKRFRKAMCPIVERLCCSMMMHGRNNGKKLMAVRIVRSMHSRSSTCWLTRTPSRSTSMLSRTVAPARTL